MKKCTKTANSRIIGLSFLFAATFVFQIAVNGGVALAEEVPIDDIAVSQNLTSDALSVGCEGESDGGKEGRPKRITRRCPLR